MPRECVVAVYDSYIRAKAALSALEGSELPPDRVSFVLRDVERETSHPEAIQYGDRAERDGTKGAAGGGLVGLLLGLPVLLIPGIGPLLIAGPIATGLTGAIVGGFLGVMAGWGVHPDHIQEYEDRIRNGAVLIVVDGSPDEVAEAKRILDETEVESIALHAETSADDVDP